VLMDRWLGRGKPMLSEPVAVTLQVVDLLEALGVPYLIGGSFASAIHGVARMTMDTDLVADLRLDHVEPLAQARRRFLSGCRVDPRCRPPSEQFQCHPPGNDVQGRYLHSQAATL